MTTLKNTVKATSKPSTVKKPVKAATKTAPKNAPLVDVKKEVKKVTFSNLSNVEDISTLTSDISILFDSRFTKGWDSKVFSIFKDIPTIKDGKAFNDYASNSEQRYLVHYVGLLAMYKALGYKAIKRDDITISVDYFGFLNDSDYPKGLLSWNLTKELADIPKHNKGFKFQHLVRAHLVMIKHGVSMV